MQDMKTKSLIPPRPAKTKWATIVLGMFALALVVGIRDPDSSPLAPALPVSRRKPMPDFTLQTLEGKPWTLSQHRGRVVLLNFWATWCPPCQAETPSLVKIANANRERGLDVVGVAMDQENQDSLKNIQSFVTDYHVPYPVLLPKAVSPVTNGIQSYPTTYLIDRQGRIANAFTGALDEASLRPELERLLDEPAVAAPAPVGLSKAEKDDSMKTVTMVGIALAVLANGAIAAPSSSAKPASAAAKQTASICPVTAASVCAVPSHPVGSSIKVDTDGSVHVLPPGAATPAH